MVKNFLLRSNKLVLFAFFVILAVIFILPRNASADEGNGTLRHAYKPFTVTETKWMRARVDNFSAVPQKRLVCVEAFNVSTNAKTHLGCLWVDLAGRGGDMWAAEFDAPTNMLSPGTYNVVYTYQAADGSWNRIKSINLEMQDGMYTR